MHPHHVSNDKHVLWLGDDAGKVCIFLTLLVLVCFCNSKYPAELIFESVNGLPGDHAVEACQFVAKGNQPVVG